MASGASTQPGASKLQDRARTIAAPVATRLWHIEL